MRKLLVLTFVTLDGVMQAPGGPDEDSSNHFKHGGWSVSYWDNVIESAMMRQMGHPFDMLLGRKTYEVFADAWPKLDPDSAINHNKKYVVTHRPLPDETDIWKNSVRIEGEVVEEIRKLKSESGPEIQVHGSCDLIQTLLMNDLVDEFWLKIYPVVVGDGKRLFGEGAIAGAFTLIDSAVSPSGVIIASYKKAGEIKLGSFS